ncbi:formate dehydrogenase subunit alpha [Coralloluteibacterium stylophorae]|uniref:Formate dehydrogenase subunit alpha n=1 Tax=Coralloluteibacterium stylophorae TaxID=1776034 RepID=A0A8J7VS22_9GAMM|nr:formate dehydrogenase subunit alpha [Coralloluteibacterium stylophorae]MBS7456980.1 formate dehydrogenase subunit alpha [Coralloluteibacterium stylophorae]
MTRTRCTFVYDGLPIEADAGQLLPDVLDAQGIALPHVCYHPSLGPLQTCDTCWVEIDGELVRGCTVAARDGLVVAARGAQAAAAREEGMDRLLAKHELYCTLCENNTGDCTLHNSFADMDIAIQRYRFERKPYDKDESSPFYTYDPDQCILCGRCVEACQNVEVNETLSIDYQSEHPRVLWDGGRPIDESSCVHCGHCVTVCPCNALMEKTMQPDAGPLTAMPQSLKRPLIDLVKDLENTIGAPPITAVSKMDMHWRQPEIRRTKTVCTYCGVGCAFEMWTRDRHILKVQPVVDAPANGISTCIKGRFAWDFVNSDKRLTTPLVRENGAFREASWDEALDLVARRLLAIRNEHGPDSIGFIGSSKASNEEAYLTQKIARLVIGTNSVDNSSRYCQNPATKGLFRTVGYGGDAGSIRDIESAALVVLVGSNLAENHPVIASRVKAAKKLRGQKLIVADVRRHEMARRADLFLRPNSGSDTVWALAIARYIFDHGLEDREFLARHVNKVEEFRASLAPFTLDFAEEVTGIPQAQLVEAAEMIARAETVCLLWAMGVTQHSHGSDISTALSNLLLVTGNYGKPGTGGYPMRGHNNVQGASDFGCLKNMYPGYEKVEEPGNREKWAKAWGVAPEALSDHVGLDNYTMVLGAGEGKVRAMFIIGEETAVSDSHASHTQDAFRKLDFMVVQDIVMSRTAEFADVVLPAAPSVEKEGTFTNTERRIQRFYRVLEPLGDSRPDWEILTDLARRMGHDWGYTHPSQIMDEVAGIADMFAGVSYERLEGWKSLQWPVAKDGTDTPLLYTDGFHTEDGKATFHPLEWKPPEEAPDAEYDLLLDNGRLLEHFQSTNQTGPGGRIDSQVPAWFVEVGSDLAAERGIEDGTWLRVTSRRDSVEVRAVVTDRVQGRTLYMPIHHVKPGMNQLTGPHHDPDVDTPAYKETAVRIEVLPRPKGEPALPYNNYRYGQRTPNGGTDAGAKWARPDYVEPPATLAHPERM